VLKSNIPEFFKIKNDQLVQDTYRFIEAFEIIETRSCLILIFETKTRTDDY
jgi:hypothetical protein